MKTFDEISAAGWGEGIAQWSVGVVVNRLADIPLDKTSIQKNYTTAQEYLTGPKAYLGQIITILEGEEAGAYIVVANDSNTALTLKKLGEADAVASEASGLSELSTKVGTLSGEVVSISSDLATEVSDRETAITNLSVETFTKIDSTSAHLTSLIDTASTTAHNELTSVSSDLDAKIDALSTGIEDLDSTVTNDNAPTGDADGITISVAQKDGKLEGVSATIKVTNEITTAVNALSTANDAKFVTKADQAISVVTTDLTATTISASNLSVDNATFDATTATFGTIDATDLTAQSISAANLSVTNAVFDATTATITKLETTEISATKLSVSSGDELIIGVSSFNDIIADRADNAITDAITSLTGNVTASGTAAKGGAFALTSVTQTNGKLTGSASTVELEVVSNKVTAITDSVSDNAYPTAKAVSAYVTEEIKDLAGVMHFLGAVASAPTEGTTDITIEGATVTPKAGDFIIVTGSAKEFVFNGTKWIELGDEVNHSSKAFTGEGTVSLDSSLTSSTLAGAINEVKTKVDGYETSLTTGDLTATNISATNISVDNATFDATTATIGTLEATSISATNLSAESLSTIYAGDKSLAEIFKTEVTDAFGGLNATETNATKNLATTGNDGLSVTIAQKDGLITGVSASVKVAGAIETAVNALSTANDAKFVTKADQALSVVTNELTATAISASSLSVEDAELNIVNAQVTKFESSEVSAGTLSVQNLSDVKITSLNSTLEDMFAWHSADEGIAEF